MIDNEGQKSYTGYFMFYNLTLKQILIKKNKHPILKCALIKWQPSLLSRETKTEVTGGLLC